MSCYCWELVFVITIIFLVFTNFYSNLEFGQVWFIKDTSYFTLVCISSSYRQVWPFVVEFSCINCPLMYLMNNNNNISNINNVQGVPEKKKPKFSGTIIKIYFFKNVHIIGKLIFSSFIWHHNHDGRVTHDWVATICTWYGTLIFVQGKWGSYANVKNHNEPNVVAIHLFWLHVIGHAWFIDHVYGVI